MFANHLRKFMEVYFDDIFVKSKKSCQHLQHLEESFKILNQYEMKLNPAKYSFRVTSSKFLGNFVSRRGIEVDPNKVKTVLDMSSQSSKKDIHKLTSQIIALSRLISRSSDWCKSFFNILC